ncbi:MAG: hypothetical protein M3O46_19020 [Myxococcota bacterium]|nr:hypothetical protein [Myxococcota bacterium]
MAIFAISHHEMWRDELHCWLVARDSATPWDVVRNRAYDGHPPLWYLLLWVLEKTTHDPRSMQIAHVGIAAAVVAVFANRAPFPRPLRALFPFGYFLAYEYVAISRCYGLAFLFALLLCVHHSRRFQRPAATALLIAALALTTTVATMVAAGYAAALIVDCIEATRRREPNVRRMWIPVAAAAASCLAAALCAWPPADSTVAHVRWPSEIPSDFAPTRLIAGLLPIPRADFFFWNSNALLSFEPFRRNAWIASTCLAAWLTFVLSRDRGAALLFGIGAILLIALFGGVYGGDVRHHGFFFVLFVMSAWIASGTTTCGAAGWSRFRQRALVPTLTVLLLMHIPGAAIALAYDWKYVFSSGRRAADVLRDRAPAAAPMIAEVDYPATAVLGQLGPRAVAFSPRTGRTFSFVKWTRDRRWEPTDGQCLEYAATLGRSRGEDAILIMNRPLTPTLIDGSAVVKIAELYDSMIEEENFYIYRVARQAPRFVARDLAAVELAD